MIHRCQDDEYRPIRHDVRLAVLDFLNNRECWVSRGEVIAELKARNIPVPNQISVVLGNMVKKGWLMVTKEHGDHGRNRWYVVDGQICRGAKKPLD